MVGGVGLREEAHLLPGNDGRAREFCECAVTELLRALPNMRVAINNHVVYEASVREGEFQDWPPILSAITSGVA